MRPAKLTTLAACLLTSSLILPLYYASAADSPLAGEDPSSGPLRYAAHKMTTSEMLALRDVFGVRDTTMDYNVIVDGFGTGLAPPTEDGWLSMVGTVNVLESVEYDLEALPPSYDLSTLPTFPAVGNQRSQPSCSAWAAAYYAYGFQEAVDQGWEQASEGATDQLISPAWTYNKANNGRDSGSWMDENMMVLTDWGAATLATMPFDQYDYLDWGSPDAFREAPAHRAAEVFTIEYTGQSTIDQIKTLVTEGIPVTFGIDATEFSGALDDYIITSVEYSSFELNHAQTIVGFDDSTTGDGEVGAFRVVNSWGDAWGDSGYYWFTYDAMKELGDNDLAVINYVTDIDDYSPSIVLTWHFDTGPSRSATVEVGIGSPASPAQVKSPFYTDDTAGSHLFPEFMCLDVTEFSESYGLGVDDFYISIGPSSTKGPISSFKVGLHEGAFAPGSPTHSSGQSADVPVMSPCTVTNSIEYYGYISADEAMDATGPEFLSTGSAHWVAVDHHSQDGVDSMQSGDIAGGESTGIQVEVEGPVDVSFFWKVSSQSGGDRLSFSVEGTDIEENISGDVDWEEVSVTLDTGTHTLVWNYSKDSSSDSLEDTAWVDSLSLSQPVPSFSLEPAYEAVYGVPLLITPLDVENPFGGAMSFWYVWGDGDEGPGDPEADNSASHAYLGLGDFDLVVHMEDSVANNVSASATVTVADVNLKPEILSTDVEPGTQYHAPGSLLWVNVTVSDAEGDELTVYVDMGDGNLYYFAELSTDPDDPLTVSVEHSYDVGYEEPYSVEVTVYDEAAHALPGWNSDSVEILVNTPPVASFIVDPMTGETETTFSFDASGSSDAETASNSIDVRWDWDGDGGWDTPWSSEKTAAHSYLVPGSYEVVLEVRDANGLTSSTTVEIEVTGEPIPEFPFLLLPVLALMTVFALMRRRFGTRDGAA